LKCYNIELAGGTSGEGTESLPLVDSHHQAVGMESILRMAFLLGWRIIFLYLPLVMRQCGGFWRAKGRILTGSTLRRLAGLYSEGA
jgi:hypothetical protein